MHRIAAAPGGWNPDEEGVVFVEQRPAPFIFLTAADTDIQTLSVALPLLPQGFPAIRATNLLHLQQQLTIDTYAEDVLESAQIILLRILGGRAYWSYGLEVVKQTVAQTQAHLLVLPGDDRPDPDLMSHSTVPLAIAHRVWHYLIEGGPDNLAHALQFAVYACLHQGTLPPPPAPIPRTALLPLSPPTTAPAPTAIAPRVGILFYRAHYLSGNIAPIQALCAALRDRHLHPVPIFVSSLRDPDVQADVLAIAQPKEGEPLHALLNTTSFSLARLDGEAPHLDLWERLDIPVIQTILSGGTVDQWRVQSRGLTPRDVAMNVALPEVDGRIIGRAISFKAAQVRHPDLETEVVTYEPIADRVQFVADLAANWVQLRQTPVGDRRIALILANYPTRDARLANGVGLDTPASCLELLKALHQAGYTVTDIPATGDELIQRLTQGVTNDPEGRDWRTVHQALPGDRYRAYFATLPSAVQQGVSDRWNAPPEDLSTFPIPGLQFGNVFVGVQPSRGYDLDPALNYHAPDLEPTHAYLAYYHWVRAIFGAQAIVHVGKHGNLEWLPGKSVALSELCYPEVAVGPLPHLYPFIVNDPGEGSQAKRRAQAVIIDHLTPPMTRAELYGPLQQLEGLIDEYYEAQSLNPSRLPAIRDRITALVQHEHLHLDLGLTLEPSLPTADLSEFISRTDGYLCELKEAQIRDGLHILGQCPTGRQLRDLMVAIARQPGVRRVGLTQAIAQSWGLDFDPLTAQPTEPVTLPASAPAVLQTCHHAGDVIAALEQEAARQVETLLTQQPNPSAPLGPLQWVRDSLLPALQQSDRELINLLRGLDGRYVPSGPSGAPTRGRPEVLPTGRNFYSVDIRAIPTESAWDVGRRAAEALIERYTQEQGEYPRTLALSIWGTSTMRTGGDDLAEALALLGVRPLWDGTARRVVDFEILPLPVLGRPRVDVTLRISGFFRDAFPNLIDLFHQAVQAVANLQEDPSDNPLAAQVQQDTTQWQTAGLPLDRAKQRSLYRVFGSKPGAYGAGLQGLIDAQNWQTDEDLARAYINWSSYAYTGQGNSHSAPDAFEQRLRHLQIVLHNQDNREHDLLDSDDYYQFHGGLTAAVRSRSGQSPITYFGDHSRPQQPRIRTLKEEVNRVYRSRVINPKWIEGVMRHGYKGAFELAATVDYLFAYDATAHCVEAHIYTGVAQAYLLNPAVQRFIQQKNPWALRDMAERLLEAHQRGLWAQPDASLLEHLRAIALEAEGAIEAQSL